MNTDMPAFSAFALESYRSTGHAGGDCQTLTLALAIAPLHTAHEPMGGNARAGVPVDGENMLRAAVLPAEGPVLTLTF